MPNREVDIRRHGPLAERSGVVTTNDPAEDAGIPLSRTREFRDELTKATGPSTQLIPTQIIAWRGWDL